MWSIPKRSCSRVRRAASTTSQWRSSLTRACAESATIPLVMDQTCRSCTDVTPGVSSISLRTRSTSMCPGALSISTATVSRSRFHDEKTTSRPMRTETTGSAHRQSKRRMSSPPAIAPTLPSASVSTWSHAPRMLRLPPRPAFRIHRPTRFTTSPPVAIPIMSAPCTSGGSRKRSHASTKMKIEIATSVAPFTSAARISVR